MKRIRYIVFLLVVIIYTMRALHEDISGPGPLFSFGQAIIHAGDFVWSQEITQEQPRQDVKLSLSETFYYGITSEFNVVLDVPFLFSQEIKPNGKGLGRIGLQGEYFFFKKKYDKNTQHMLSIVETIRFPTATSKFFENARNFSFFTGLTHLFQTDKLYHANGVGVRTYTRNKGVKPGVDVLYEGVFGYVIKKKEAPHKSILSAIIEFNGTYTRPAHTRTGRDPNTASNIIFVGPSLIYSFGNNKLLQIGAQWAIDRILFGNQDREEFRAAILFSMTFQTR